MESEKEVIKVNMESEKEVVEVNIEDEKERERKDNVFSSTETLTKNTI